jgi:hypothetical protein
VDSRAGLDDLPGLEFRALGRPARSQSLHRLRYPGFSCNSITEVILLVAVLTVLPVILVIVVICTSSSGNHGGGSRNSIVTYIPTARQRLSKHIPVGANARNNRASTARQRISKHA